MPFTCELIPWQFEIETRVLVESNCIRFSTIVEEFLWGKIRSMENDGIYFIVVHDSLLVPIESNGWFVPQLTARFKFFCLRDGERWYLLHRLNNFHRRRWLFSRSDGIEWFVINLMLFWDRCKHEIFLAFKPVTSCDFLQSNNIFPPLRNFFSLYETLWNFERIVVSIDFAFQFFPKR